MSVHSRHLNLASATNFRDLGGYPTTDGRTVRWRSLFRSNHLGNLTTGDIGTLRALGLKNVLDLRGAEERRPTLCRLEGVSVHSVPIEPVIVPVLRSRLATGKPLGQSETEQIMRDSYRNYVRHHTPTFRTLFGHLLKDRAPLVLHCSAGKDRTGFASALILRALGVRHELVIEDYLLTNRYWRMDASTTGSEFPSAVSAVLARAEESFLAAALDTIESDHNGLESYFDQGLGIGIEQRAKLQALYLDS